MNTRIEAGSMSISLSATLVAPVILVQDMSWTTPNPVRAWTCFNFPVVSVNGHSLKSINPELKVGELATSLA
jgi:hypothetical protein